MISASNPRRFFPRAALSAALFLAALAGTARAEDPLLGKIKLIKCVGCEPGSVNLVVHDPIDVRDFEIQIKESDYQKIITPLAGKTIFDKEGCFYWMDMPKSAKPPASKATGKDAEKKAADTTGKKDAAVSAASDSSKAASGLQETSEPKGTPSRCIPYVRVETKPTGSGADKDKE